jgi:hypothetical protein
MCFALSTNSSICCIMCLPEVYFERFYLHCIAYVIWLARTKESQCAGLKANCLLWHMMVLHAKLVLVCSRQGHVSLSIVLANYGLGAGATGKVAGQ